MARPTRTYTLKLSPAGVELLLECHFRLCHLTSELLPYGQTLFAASIHLRGLEPVLVLDDLKTLRKTGYLGDRNCFVGGPGLLAELVGAVGVRVSESYPEHDRAIALTHLFVIALKRFRTASSDDVIHAYRKMIAEAGAHLKISRTQRDLAGH